MSEFSERWLNRLMAVIAGLNWLFLILGSVTALIQFPGSAWPAMILAGIYVVAFQLLPRRLLLMPIWREGAAVIATGLTAAAMSFTGSFQSSFLLLAITPVMLAALFGGYRLGFATAGLSAGILIAVSVPMQQISYSGLGSWLGLLLLVAATFGLARRLILEAMDHVEALTEITAETGARLEQLENTNVLLTKLVALTGSDELSAATVGEASLNTIRSAVPFDGAEMFMLTNDQLVLVATSGTASEYSTTISIKTPLLRTIGELHLFTSRPLTDRQLEVVDELLASTAVSFTNIAMLEEIAANAIRDERLRVARELHDGLGPGLASLGLAIDVAAMGSRGALEDQLVSLRSSVTDLVTDMRSAVEDLRTDPNSSTLSAIRRELIGATPPAKISLAETELIPPDRRDNITAIALEAIRNARTHNSVAEIAVTGHINGTRGHIRIEDAGVGFDPAAPHEGRFGIVGMHERAEAAGATVRIESTPETGTTVIIEWEPQ
ncbi:MAG: histidine kinase [Acidimicrobiia bacterium]|nr:histidine kinase [Acidimicrobiia bacterium]